MKKNVIILSSIIAMSVLCISLTTGCGNKSNTNESYDIIETETESLSENSANEKSAYTTEKYVNNNEKKVRCLACTGLGHNPYEVNGNPCTVCLGKGMMPEGPMRLRYEKWKKEVIPCNICNGTGLSYEARVTGLMNIDITKPQGYYNCKVCKGKKKGTRAELIYNFKVAQEVYGPAL